MYYLIQYTYKAGEGTKVVSLVVESYSTKAAISKLGEHTFSNYIEREISDISESEFMLLRHTELDAGLWGVNKPNTGMEAVNNGLNNYIRQLL